MVTGWSDIWGHPRYFVMLSLGTHPLALLIDLFSDLNETTTMVTVMMNLSKTEPFIQVSVERI